MSASEVGLKTKQVKVPPLTLEELDEFVAFLREKKKLIPYDGFFARVRAALEHLKAHEMTLDMLNSNLRQIELHCPCGARPEDLHRFSHVPGCPVEIGLVVIRQCRETCFVPKPKNDRRCFKKT